MNGRRSCYNTHCQIIICCFIDRRDRGWIFLGWQNWVCTNTHTHTHSYIYIFCSNFEYFTMCEAEITLSRQIFIWINAFYDVNHNRNFFGFLLFCKMIVKRNQCDQMLDLKSCPNVFKSCLNNIHSSFYINRFFPKQPKSQQSFCATFEIEFVAKNFQKSPNLVTLSVIQLRGTQTSF